MVMVLLKSSMISESYWLHWLHIDITFIKYRLYLVSLQHTFEIIMKAIIELVWKINTLSIIISDEYYWPCKSIHSASPFHSLLLHILTQSTAQIRRCRPAWSASFASRTRSGSTDYHSCNPRSVQVAPGCSADGQCASNLFNNELTTKLIIPFRHRRSIMLDLLRNVSPLVE